MSIEEKVVLLRESKTRPAKAQTIRELRQTFAGTDAGLESIISNGTCPQPKKKLLLEPCPDIISPACGGQDSSLIHQRNNIVPSEI